MARHIVDCGVGFQMEGEGMTGYAVAEEHCRKEEGDIGYAGRHIDFGQTGSGRIGFGHAGWNRVGLNRVAGWNHAVD